MTAGTIYEIPTVPQSSTQTISLNGTLYQIALNWCAPAACWMMNIADQNGNAIVNGVPLVTGADLLAQFEYLGIGSGIGMFVQSDNDPDEVPSYGSLGSTSHLFFIAPP